MKIGIDASRAFVKQRTGIEEYSYQVIKHLMDKLEGHQVVLYINITNYETLQKYKNTKELKLPDSWKIKVIKFPYLWTQVGLSLEMLFHPVDVLFVPSHVVPIIHPKNTIVTVHGLEYEIFPEGYSFWARFYMRWSIKLSCRWAKKIIAVSQNSKRDLMRLYKVPEDKIEVIYEGTTHVIASEAKQSRLSEINSEIATSSSKIQTPRNDTKEPYLLFIGRLERRKNIEGIISAFDAFKDKYKTQHKLVLSGNYGYGEEGIKNRLERSRYKDYIIETGFAGEKEKWQLLKNADVFLFPTFYEGFGLPILEAQSVGVPVVASNNSSLSEIGENSVVYCDPQNPESIAEAAYSLISNSELRNDIIKKGYENITRFSWGECASSVSSLLADKN